MRKLSARWVTRLLTPDNKRNCEAISEQCLTLFKRNPKEFLRRYVTVDETWIHWYTPETKEQSKQWTAQHISTKILKFQIRSTVKPIRMVLKVEDGEQYGESKPILDTSGTSDVEETDLTIQDVYKNITSSMKTDPLTIDKPAVALDLFSTAVHVKNAALARQCMEILNNHLNKRDVLLILKHLSKCGSDTGDPCDTEPSAPPMDEPPDEAWIQDLVDNLRNNCLLEIDKHADYVLKQKEFLDLGYADVLSITTRDTLQVSNEIIVYSAIMRWCIEECKRRTLQTQKVNLKAVLRDLVYAPRYGLMSKKEFLCRTIDGVKGPDRSGILDESETERILEHIKKRGKNRPDELPFKGSVPRRTGYEKPWVFHSGMSRDSACSTKGVCDKFIINFLTCWTAIFD